MTVAYRKLVYTILAAGSLYLALLAVTNLWFGLLVLPATPGEGVLRILSSVLGLIGFVCAWAAILRLPVRSTRERRFIVLGVLAGFCAMLMAYALEHPLAASAMDFWRVILFSYVFGGTVITGLALLVELLLGPNSSSKPTPLRGAA